MEAGFAAAVGTAEALSAGLCLLHLHGVVGLHSCGIQAQVCCVCAVWCVSHVMLYHTGCDSRGLRDEDAA